MRVDKFLLWFNAIFNAISSDFVNNSSTFNERKYTGTPVKSVPFRDLKNLDQRI